MIHHLPNVAPLDLHVSDDTSTMPNKVQNVAVIDTTDDDGSNAVYYTIIYII